jgi:hypothetical protein
MPLLADTTAAAMYPGNAAFLSLDAPEKSTTEPAGDSPVFRTMDLVAVLHATLAGLFMFSFLRVIGLEALAAVLGGLVFACSGTMGWFAAWYIQMQNSAVWLPLILACVHCAADGPALRLQWVALGAAAVALQWLAGFPELSFYTGLLAVAYAASRLQRGQRALPLVAVASIYVAGILLASVQLLPALELASLSRRPASMSLEVFQSLAASPSMVLGWILPSQAPGMEFPPATAYHFGIAAIVAAAFGIVSRSRTAVFFTLVLIAAFLLSIGGSTPVSAWVWHVPVFYAFRHPFKHLFELSFAIAGLAALGASRFLQVRPRASWPKLVVAGAIAATVVSLRINETHLIAGNPANVDTSGERPDVASHVEAGWRVLTPRHFFLSRDPASLLGDYATEFEVPAVHGAGPYLWSALADATGMVEEEVTLRPGLFSRPDRTLALLSSPYVIQTRRDDAFWPALEPAVYRAVAETPAARLMKRDDALPRFRFVTEVRCGDAQAIAASLREGTPDPADVALVDCSGTESISIRGGGPPPPSAKLLEERPGHLAFAADVAKDTQGFLVVSQADLPGWRATTDGVPAAIRRVDGLVQGIEIPGGTTRIELDYQPRSFVVGAAVSAATLVAVLLLAIFRRETDAG